VFLRPERNVQLEGRIGALQYQTLTAKSQSRINKEVGNYAET